MLAQTGGYCPFTPCSHPSHHICRDGLPEKSSIRSKRASIRRERLLRGYLQPSRKPNLRRIYSSRLLELKFEIVCSKIYIFFQHFPKCRHDPCGVTNPRNTDQLPEGNTGFLQLVKTEQILLQPCPKGAKKWEEWLGTIFFFLVNFQRRITTALHWLPIF